MRRSLITGTIVLALLALALPQAGESAGWAQKGGKKKKEKVVVAQLTLHDNFAGTQVLSDGKQRTGSDNDGDGFFELVSSMDSGGLVFYQDHRISKDNSGIHPDPCSGFDIVTSGRNTGRVFADMDRGAGDAFKDCTIFEDPAFDPTRKFLNDARTVTLEFDKNEAGDACACDEFRFLNAISGAGTTFVEDLSSCSLTVAAGPIVTDSSDPPRTGNPRISAFPFSEVKKKGSSSLVTATSVHINFVVDREVAGVDEPNQWGVWSQVDIPVATVVDPLDPANSDTRTITSTDESYKLIHFGVDSPEAPTCSGFTMPFQMTFERFEVPAQ